jgi:hypothetical protein
LLLRPPALTLERTARERLWLLLRPPALTLERTARERLWLLLRPPALTLVLIERPVFFVVEFILCVSVRVGVLGGNA